MAHNSGNTYLTGVPLDPNERPRYSKDQLNTYFKRINLPQNYLDSPALSDPSLMRTKEHGVPLVTALVRQHLVTVPFENLELHYSTHRTISLNMGDLFEKFAERGLKYGRGGRCMENNGFFGTVLRSLGCEVRNCGGRVSRAMSPIKHIREDQGHTYDGWNHMLNLVKFDDAWWVVDVGMGTMGPAVPYPLQDGFETASVEPRQIRLQKRPILESYANPSNGVNPPEMWCYDVCLKPPKDGEEKKWIPHYCFTETEFLPQDYEMMSWFTSTNKKCFFTYTVVVMRFVSDETGEKIIGNITLVNDGVTKNIGAEREHLRELKTEQDRIDALKEFFEIELTEEEKKSITPELKI